MFLMHPWELVDLKAHYPNLKEWVLELCKDDFSKFEQFFSEIKKSATVLQAIARQGFGVPPLAICDLAQNVG